MLFTQSIHNYFDMHFYIIFELSCLPFKTNYTPLVPYNKYLQLIY